ncbi:hypothetical protein DAEQUDRAFT_815293 [Daedalea quercina L-15889]|uniref:Uncharacterized protein n=1 Tax=Daedalea quercina L-15889 TaxID=1314783 RepID=A0A165L6I0_9APHY|nr:hypothetical protein DAEQUDRAFT_815293 [Daedalea quercina L-15889]
MTSHVYIKEAGFGFETHAPLSAPPPWLAMPSDVLEIVNSEDEREVHTSLVCPHTSFVQLPRLHGAAAKYVCCIRPGSWWDRSTGLFPLHVLLRCPRLSIGPWDDIVVIQDVWQLAPFAEDPAHPAAAPMLTPEPFAGVNEIRRGWRHADDPSSSMLDATLSAVADAAPGRPGRGEGGVVAGVNHSHPLSDGMLLLANAHAVDTAVPWGAGEPFPPFAYMPSREHAAQNTPPFPGLEFPLAPSDPQRSPAQAPQLLTRLPVADPAETQVAVDPTRRNDWSHTLISSGSRDARSPRVSVPENVAQGDDGAAQPPVLAPSLPRPALGSFGASSSMARSALLGTAPIAPGNPIAPRSLSCIPIGT